MQTRRIRTLHKIITALLTSAGAMGALYVWEASEVRRLRGDADQALPVLSVDVDNQTAQKQEPGMPNQDVPAVTEAAAAGEDSMSDADATAIAELMQSKEAEVEQAMKDRMKALVTGEDGSPLKMLRSFFPENLIYSFENEYVFAPVLEEVEKHSLLEENFQKTEEGLMQYVENGAVTSHKGIDVSKYQGTIDWSAVKEEGIEYAFIRLGLRGYESAKIVLDEYYEANMKGANSAGVAAGVYFFTQAVTVEEAKEEADFVIEHLAGYDVSCPVVFDVERISGGKGRADQLTK